MSGLFVTVAVVVELGSQSGFVNLEVQIVKEAV